MIHVYSSLITGKFMINATISTPEQGRLGRTRITRHSLREEIRWLSDRVEDLEGLRELHAAIERNKGKKLIPWAQVKKELGLDDL